MAPSPGSSADPGLLDSTSRYSLPHPLAELYARSRSAVDLGTRYGLSFRLVEGVVRFLAYVQILDAAAQGASDPELAGWLKPIEIAGLGKLAHVAKSTGKWLEERGNPFLAESTDLWGGSWQEALGRIIDQRNRFAHDEVSVPHSEAEPLLERLEPDLRQVLSGVTFLCRYHLGIFRGLRRRGQLFASSWAPSRGREETGQVVPVTSADSPLDEVPVLFAPSFEHGLYLDPFLGWARSATDGTERMFWLLRTEKGVSRYGHPFLRHEPVRDPEESARPVSGSPLPPRGQWSGPCRVGLDEVSRKAMGGGMPSLAQGSRYVLKGKIGEGSMGAVYEGRDTDLDRQVAIKLIRPELMQSSDAQRRLVREARLLANVDVPEVVRIHDIRLREEPGFLVMELVSGEDLGAYIERRGPLPVEEAVHILQAICRAISAVHAAGVIHRDVKPSNVMVGADRIRLLDFGIALPEKGTRYSTAMDRVGTPLYMAPEQWDGIATKASDIYSTGRVLAAMLLGRPPPIAGAPGDLLAGLPEPMRAVILRATAPRPEDRYATPAELAEAASWAGGRREATNAAVPPVSSSTAPEALHSAEPTAPPAGTSSSRTVDVRMSWRNRPLTLRPSTPAERASMESFAQLWGPTRTAVAALGWRPLPGAIIELYLDSNDESMVTQVFISPFMRNRFLVRMTPRLGFSQVVLKALSKATGLLQVQTTIRAPEQARPQGPISVIEVVSSWDSVVGSEDQSDAAVARKLCAFVEPLVRAIPKM